MAEMEFIPSKAVLATAGDTTQASALYAYGRSLSNGFSNDPLSYVGKNDWPGALKTCTRLFLL